VYWLNKLGRFLLNAFNNIYASICIFALTIIVAEYLAWDYLPLWLHFRLALCLIISFITGIIAGWNFKEGWEAKNNGNL